MIRSNSKYRMSCKQSKINKSWEWLAEKTNWGQIYIRNGGGS